MKKETFKNLAVMTILLAACIVTGFSSSGVNATYTGNKNSLPVPATETLRGITEFYFKSPGDSRTWHIKNRYINPDSEDKPDYNTSYYSFSADTVTVINEYIGIPEAVQWDLNLATQNLK
jgi:hypothetical protein